jgi:hypothetical protein
MLLPHSSAPFSPRKPENKRCQNGANATRGRCLRWSFRQSVPFTRERSQVGLLATHPPRWVYMERSYPGSEGGDSFTAHRNSGLQWNSAYHLCTAGDLGAGCEGGALYRRSKAGRSWRSSDQGQIPPATGLDAPVRKRATLASMIPAPMDASIATPSETPI